MNEYKIPVSHENKKIMFKALHNGISDFRDNFQGIQSSFDNGYGLVTWSFIYNRIYHDTPSTSIISIKTKRGGWPLAVMFDEESGYLYAFVRKKNFINRQKSKKGTPLYYLQGLSTYNTGLESEIPASQLNPYQEYVDFGIDLEERDSLLTSVLNEYRSQVKRFCIVLFDTYNGEIVEFGAVLTNEQLDDFYEENWNHVIEVDYKDTNDTQTSENDQHDIALEFKEQNIKKTNEES
ncbi:DUF5986 family protein [Virgibacillus oceani]|uniref:Uncharacterized protein n=1 Tax=Virgibacillus oceani TaxID=1479511 RepID=A0A917HPS1_9BACI|nr:DUF5986 family protein [Virgibacillus oceani]GGG85119.1 hypothetical protein GCM10011398_33590 [Virgibacillus oceani]